MQLIKSPHLRRTFFIGLFLAGVALGAIACGLLVMHTRTFSLKRDTAVMIGTTLPELKSRVALLAANRQAEQLFSENAMAAREEQASVFVLPSGPAASRAVTALQEIAAAITKAGGSVTVQSVVFDSSPQNFGSFKTVTAHVKIKGDMESVSRLFAVLAFSGDMMIRDVFSDDIAERFLTLVEASAPLSLKRAEDFLYLDLLQYAGDPDRSEEEMLMDMSSDAQADIRSFVLQNGLAAVRGSLGDIAMSLKDKAVWPLPLLRVQGAEKEGDVWIADLVFYRR